MENELNVLEIKRNIDEKGFHTIYNFLNNEEIKLLRSYIKKLKKQLPIFFFNLRDNRK